MSLDTSDRQPDSHRFTDPYHRVYQIAPVTDADLPDAIALWKELGTHNGDEAHAKKLVEVSRQSFHDGIERFTLMGKKFDGFGEDGPRLQSAGIGSVIYHDHTTAGGTQHYYVETSDGFQLESLREDALELGGMYVDPAHRGKAGRELGVAMTMSRALLARKFEELIGPRRVYADFLPPLDKGYIPGVGKEEKVPLGNAFWFEIVHPVLYVQSLIRPISDYCCNVLGVYPKTREHLYYQLLVQLSQQDLNYIVATFFPKELRISAEMYGRMRSILDDFGEETKGAKVNVGHAYPDLNRVGYNPVDAGQNWAGSTNLGAIGDSTVAVDVLEGEDAESIYKNPSSQCALILHPTSGTRKDLQNFKVIVTPGIFAERLARVPRDSLRLLAEDALAENIPSEITYRVLPSKSPA